MTTRGPAGRGAELGVGDGRATVGKRLQGPANLGVATGSCPRLGGTSDGQPCGVFDTKPVKRSQCIYSQAGMTQAKPKCSSGDSEAEQGVCVLL